MTSRLFTVDEANRTLPYVARVVGEIRERYAALRRNGRLHKETPEADEGRRRALKEQIRHDAQRIRECQEELTQVGAVLKDYDKGLVDFPAEYRNRPILLCWEPGEERVGFWHDETEGYFGRQPVPGDQPDWPRIRVAHAPAGPE